MGLHVVAQGECLASIAHQYGFAWQTIYNAPENGELRRRRPNPNVLHPGDHVVIPERMPVGGRVATGRQHEFRVHGAHWVLRLRLLDHHAKAWAGVHWKVTVEGSHEPVEGTTGTDGLIECSLPGHARRATMEAMGRTMTLDVGALDPISRVTGVQQRLARLGYEPGVVDGIMGPRTRAAVLAFQEKHAGLTRSGVADEATRTALLALADEDGAVPEWEDAPIQSDGDGADDDAGEHAPVEAWREHLGEFARSRREGGHVG